MHAALLALAIAAPARAAAEPVEIGALLGPRFFSDEASLGHVEGADISLRNAVVVGARVAKPLFPWLVAEGELPLAATTTTELDVSVLWLDPRAHVRLELYPDKRVRPFMVAGAGVPISLSQRRGIFASGLSVDVYSGAGVSVTPGRGVNLRLDVRASLVPARGETVISAELEVHAGVWFALGGPAKRRAPPPELDLDRDTVADADDKCPDRAEDLDDFEDADGCPDIDNDGDRVLDIADKCKTIAELFNGFEDDDGCPDTVAPEVDQILGTVEGLLYGSGEVEVRDSASAALDRVAKLMAKYPSIRVVVTGHTDDQEALLPVEPAEGEEKPDPAALAVELSRARAGEVARALSQRGVAPPRIDVVGKGFEQPVSEGDTPRARLRNRRVEIHLFVPVR